MKKIIAITSALVVAALTILFAHELVDADKIQRVQNDGYYSASKIFSFTAAASAINKYYALIAGPQYFVMAGSNANSNIVMSAQGIIWSNSGFMPQYNIYAATYGNGMYVMFPQHNETNFTSTDGFTWTSVTTPTGMNTNWVALGYASNRKQFIALAIGTNLICVSTNPAASWNTNTGLDIDQYDWTDITHGYNSTGTGVWVGSAHTNINAWSLNGTNWFTNGALTITNWISVAGGTNKFIMVANNTNLFAYSSTGSNWLTNMFTNTTHTWNPTHVRYYNGKFFVSLANTNIFIYADEMGTTNCTNGYGWKVASLPSTQWWFRVKANADNMVFMATNGITARLVGASYVYDVSRSDQARANRGGETNQYFLLRVDDSFMSMNRPILQISVLNTNNASRSTIGMNVYGRTTLRTSMLSNRYVSASNMIVRSSFLPGVTKKNYGMWDERDTNAFAISDKGYEIYVTQVGLVDTQPYTMPMLLSNNCYYLIEFTNTPGTVATHKVLFHLFK